MMLKTVLIILPLLKKMLCKIIFLLTNMWNSGQPKTVHPNVKPNNYNISKPIDLRASSLNKQLFPINSFNNPD